MKRIISAIAISLSVPISLSGCAMSYGQKIEADKVSQIVKGKTTRAELESWFGPPMQAVPMPDGGRTLTWIYYRSNLGNSIYGQIPSFVTGKAKAKTTPNLTIVLGSDGLVKDVEYSPGSN